MPLGLITIVKYELISIFWNNWCKKIFSLSTPLSVSIPVSTQLEFNGFNLLEPSGLSSPCLLLVNVHGARGTKDTKAREP